MGQSGSSRVRQRFVTQHFETEVKTGTDNSTNIVRHCCGIRDFGDVVQMSRLNYLLTYLLT